MPEFVSENKSPCLGRKNPTFSAGSFALASPKCIPCTAQASHPDHWGPFSNGLITPLCDQRHPAVTTLCLSLPAASSTKPFTALRVKLNSKTLSSAYNAQKGWKEAHTRTPSLCWPQQGQGTLGVSLFCFILMTRPSSSSLATGRDSGSAGR